MCWLAALTMGGSRCGWPLLRETIKHFYHLEASKLALWIIRPPLQCNPHSTAASPSHRLSHRSSKCLRSGCASELLAQVPPAPRLSMAPKHSLQLQIFLSLPLSPHLPSKPAMHWAKCSRAGAAEFYLWEHYFLHRPTFLSQFNRNIACPLEPFYVRLAVPPSLGQFRSQAHEM